MKDKPRFETNLGTPQPGSPNYCWKKAGYRVERVLNQHGGTKARKIFSPGGAVVCYGLGHEGELAKLREMGLMVGE